MIQVKASREVAEISGASINHPERLAKSLADSFLLEFHILMFAAGSCFSPQDPTDAVILLVIVLASGLPGFWQEASGDSRSGVY
jgi:hypothetical protein